MPDFGVTVAFMVSAVDYDDANQKAEEAFEAIKKLEHVKEAEMIDGPDELVER